MSKNSKPTKRYTEQYRIQALKLAAQLGSMRQAALSLGIPSPTLYSWSMKAKKKVKPEKPVALSNDERAELLALRKQNKKLEDVNHILRQVTALFSQKDLP